MQEFDPIIFGQIEEAKEIFYEKILYNGKKKIYQDRPNVKAAELLLEHVVGKPNNFLQLPQNIKFVLIVGMSLPHFSTIYPV